MTAPFRIEQPELRVQAGQADEVFRQYLGRLLKMIPAEAVGLYTIGSGFIPEDQALGSAIWTSLCFLLVIAIRIYGTKDPAQGKPAQPVAVAIAAVAFVIWVYSLGGPFAKYHLYIPYIGSLAVLFWSFVIPIFYKGSTEE